MSDTDFIPEKHYNFRFKTIESARKAIYEGDYSGHVPPCKTNPDGTVEMNEEYLNATYEIVWVDRTGGIPTD